MKEGVLLAYAKAVCITSSEQKQIFMQYVCCYYIHVLLFFKVTTYFLQQLLRDFEYIRTFCLFFHCLPITLNILLVIGRSVEMITALRDAAGHAWN